jgi:hypothetical protein
MRRSRPIRKPQFLSSGHGAQGVHAPAGGILQRDRSSFQSKSTVGFAQARWSNETGSESLRGLARKRTIPRVAHQGPGKKTDLATRVAAEGRLPMKTIADALGVARSHLHERVHRTTAPRRHYRKAADEEQLCHHPPSPRGAVHHSRSAAATEAGLRQNPFWM